MKKKLNIKILGGFLIFGLTAFILISTYASGLVLTVLCRIHAEKLYEQAENLAAECVSSYNGNMYPLSDKQAEYDGSAKGINGMIWIADSNGTIIYDSSDRYTGKIISDFSTTPTQKPATS